MAAIRFAGSSLALVLAAVAGACGTSTSSTPGFTGNPTSTTSAITTGTLPVLIDTDMAADDIVAMAVLLRDPAVAVRAITVDGTGEVHCSTGLPNVRRMLDAFGVSGSKVGCGREYPRPKRPIVPSRLARCSRRHVRHRPAARQRHNG